MEQVYLDAITALVASKICRFLKREDGGVSFEYLHALLENYDSEQVHSALRFLQEQEIIHLGGDGQWWLADPTATTPNFNHLILPVIDDPIVVKETPTMEPVIEPVDPIESTNLETTKPVLVSHSPKRNIVYPSGAPHRIKSWLDECSLSQEPMTVGEAADMLGINRNTFGKAMATVRKRHNDPILIKKMDQLVMKTDKKTIKNLLKKQRSPYFDTDIAPAVQQGAYSSFLQELRAKIQERTAPYKVSSEQALKWLDTLGAVDEFCCELGIDCENPSLVSLREIADWIGKTQKTEIKNV